MLQSGDDCHRFGEKSEYSHIIITTVVVLVINKPGVFTIKTGSKHVWEVAEKPDTTPTSEC